MYKYQLFWVGGQKYDNAIPERIERAEKDGWEFCQVIFVNVSCYILVRKNNEDS